MNATQAATSFPLILLQPVADAQHTWVAILLETATPLSSNELGRLFGEFGLGETLDTLPCVAIGAWTDAELSTSTAGLGCRPGPHLAMHVDSYDQLRHCRESGYSWFAGNYPLHPLPGHPPRNATRHALLLQLLTLITHDADSHEIEGLIKEDAQLSYQLLRLVNSVAFSLNHKIISFAQAITLLGMRQLQRWLQLLLYARSEGGDRSPLLPRAALRAALMEALCPDQGGETREQAFMVGMFSLLDLMMSTSLKEILAPLHLPDDVANALLERSGPLGQLLSVVEVAEQGDPAALSETLAKAGIDNIAWAMALIRAYRWAIRVSREA
ncbi:MAG TPA: HDOD domain-containing protein [Rhodocyclaceae bacterium]|nr:HDOD domain-containing protein [Rhodocyclaceae bacterium]